MWKESNKKKMIKEVETPKNKKMMINDWESWMIVESS